MRGDTAFSQTEHLDGWGSDGVKFQFGYLAASNLVETAENLEESAWKDLKRPKPYKPAGSPRARPPNIKEQIVKARAGQYTVVILANSQVSDLHGDGGVVSLSGAVVLDVNNTVRVDNQIDAIDGLRIECNVLKIATQGNSVGDFRVFGMQTQLDTSRMCVGDFGNGTLDVSTEQMLSIPESCRSEAKTIPLDWSR